MKGFKFQITLVAAFRKDLNNAELIIYDLNIEKSLELSYQVIMSRFQKWLGEGLAWLTVSVNNHYINISKYEPLSQSF